MTFIERLLRYGLGFIAGIFLVILFFGRRNSCKNYLSNYLPEGRVLSEMQYLPLTYTTAAEKSLSAINVDTVTFRQQMLPKLDIDFDASDQRARPCGLYQARYVDSSYNFHVTIEKCKTLVRVVSVK